MVSKVVSFELIIAGVVEVEVVVVVEVTKLDEDVLVFVVGFEKAVGSVVMDGVLEKLT